MASPSNELQVLIVGAGRSTEFLGRQNDNTNRLDIGTAGLLIAQSLKKVCWTLMKDTFNRHIADLNRSILPAPFSSKMQLLLHVLVIGILASTGRNLDWMNVSWTK